jgi:hypothetical protein
MKFQMKSLGANGQAAWALTFGLMQVLRSKGLLTDADLRQAISNAEEMVPSRPNARDDETAELLADLKRTL